MSAIMELHQAQMKTNIVKIALILLAAVIMYLPSLSNHFLWDDTTVIEVNPALRSASPVWLFGQTFIPPVYTAVPPPYYRPMTILWFWFEYRIFGMFPIAFRIFNLTMFLCTVILLYLFVMRLFDSHEIALWSAAIFALNPVHIESVAFVCGMTDVSAGFFMLLSLILFASPRKFARLFLAPLFFLPALFSKEAALMGLAVFPLYDFLVRKKKSPRSVISMAQFIPAVVIYFFLRIYVLRVWGSYFHVELSLWERIMAVPYILLRYLQNILVPITLAPIHPDKYGQFSQAIWLLWFLALLALAALAIWKIRDRRIWFGIVMALLFLVPSLRITTFVPGAMWSERFAYIPTIGISFVLGYWIWRYRRIFSRRSRTIATIAPHVYAAFLFIIGFEYALWWRNDFMLAAKTMECAPEIADGYEGLSQLFLGIGELDSAYIYTIRALEHDSTYIISFATAAYIENLRGNHGAALEYARKSIEAAPELPLGYTNAGAAHMALGDTAAALDDFRKAAEMAPASPFAQRSYGEALISNGDTIGGTEYIWRAAQLLPDNKKLRERYDYLANLLRR